MERFTWALTWRSALGCFPGRSFDMPARSSGAYAGAVLAFLIFIPIARGRLQALLVRQFPPLTSIPVTEYYAQDVASTMLGTRRAGADLAYIQWLQYYGTTSAEEDDERHFSAHPDRTVRF